MVIVFDIGNTNIKMGLFNGDELVHTLRLASSNKTGDEYWLLIKDMLAVKNVSVSELEGAVISSVNPNLNYTIEHMVQTYFGFKPMTVGAGLKTGMNIKYDNPKELGADRVAGCVAAYRLYGIPNGKPCSRGVQTVRHTERQAVHNDRLRHGYHVQRYNRKRRTDGRCDLVRFEVRCGLAVRRRGKAA